MRESDMHGVALVFHIVEIVAVAAVALGFEHALVLEIAIARERRRLAFAEIGEDQTEIFARRVRADTDRIREPLALRRRLDAASVGAVFPAVIKAAQRIALDPAGREQRAAMRAVRRQDLRRAAFAAIEGEIL